MLMNMKSRALVAALLLLLSAVALPISTVSAVTIADYQFSGSNPASADPSTYWETDPITAGAGLAPLNIVAAGNPAPGLQNTYGDLNADGGTAVPLSLSIASDNYYSIIVTPDVDTGLSFDEFSFDLYSSGSVSVTAHLLSSVGGFNTSSVLGSHTATNQPSTFTTGTIDVSSLAGINDPIEFRLYFTRPTVGVTTNTFRTDNILLTGSVSLVPEPSTFLLFGLGAMGLVRHSRKRRPRRQLA